MTEGQEQRSSQSISSQFDKDLQAIQDSPEHLVERTSHSLQAAISDLWKMRLANETADFVLREEGSLLASLSTLNVLCNDIRKSYDKREFVDAAE